MRVILLGPGGGGLLIVESGNGLIRIVVHNVAFDIVWV